MNGKIEAIKIPSEDGVSLIALPNGNIVYGTYQKVFLLNENFQEINSFSTGGWSFCALNHKNEIYASSGQKHCIFLLDLNLNQLKKFGSEGEGNNQLNWPLGLCCHGDYLYICDYYNKRIQILNLDFEYSSTIQIDGGLRPFRVEISNTTIGISCYEATLFYNLASKALKYKHYNTAETKNINYIDSIFCTLNVKQKTLYVFGSDGNFLEEMVFHEKLSMSNDWSGSMCRYKDQLYMTDDSDKIFKFLE